MKDFYKNKKILITGHTGFKGAWLAQTLHELGARVVGVSLRPHTKPNLFKAIRLKDRVKTYFADICDYKKLDRIFKTEKPEIVMHLAAQAIVRVGYDEPMLTHKTNVLGTVNVLEAVRNIASVKAAVIVTTDKVYEERAGAVYAEGDPLGANDPYSASKAAADIVTQSYIKAFFSGSNTARVGIARAGNVIGGGDWGEDRILTDIVRARYENNNLLLIRNPDSVRPWQHVLEPLWGYALLAEKLVSGDANFARPWNFGPEDESAATTLEVVQKAQMRLANLRYKIHSDSTKPESHILRLSPERAVKELNWNPVYSLDEALRLTLDWYEQFYASPKTALTFTNKQIWDFIKLQ